MKFGYLRFKIIGGIVFLCSLIFFLVFYLIIFYQKETFFDLEKIQAYSSSEHLQSVFTQPKDFTDKTRVQEIIYSLKSSYPDLAKADINLMQNGKIITVSSLEFGSIGKEATPENYEVFRSGTSEEMESAAPVFSGSKSFFKIITPIMFSGVSYGTYEISISLGSFQKSFNIVQEKTLQIMTLGLVLLALLLFLLLEYLVLRPIKKLEKGIGFFSKGKFDYKIEEKGSDEFGRLAKGLNEMSKELYRSYDSLEDAIEQRTKELEEARTVLEIKVGARTRQLQEVNETLEKQVKEKTVELQGKIKDLERFNKLMIDRELRMIELKNEIKKLTEKESKKK
ncbi:MAG: HAMP domain-containing protein [Candidatus Paceibacterota bacterium]|jgi:methyl-accepting chemotaxis protein